MYMKISDNYYYKLLQRGQQLQGHVCQSLPATNVHTYTRTCTCTYIVVDDIFQWIDKLCDESTEEDDEHD